MYTFGDATVEDNCGWDQKVVTGFMYCLFIGIGYVLAWQFQAFFRQVHSFVHEGVLPAESSKRRNTIIIISTWLVFFADWVVYIFVDLNLS